MKGVLEDFVRQFVTVIQNVDLNTFVKIDYAKLVVEVIPFVLIIRPVLINNVQVHNIYKILLNYEFECNVF